MCLDRYNPKQDTSHFWKENMKSHPVFSYLGLKYLLGAIWMWSQLNQGFFLSACWCDRDELSDQYFFDSWGHEWLTRPPFCRNDKGEYGREGSRVLGRRLCGYWSHLISIPDLQLVLHSANQKNVAMALNLALSAFDTAEEKRSSYFFYWFWAVRAVVFFFFNFANLSYFWGLFVHKYFDGRNKYTKLELLYIIVFAIKRFLIW